MSFRIRGLWLVVSIAILGVLAALAVDLDAVRAVIGSSALRASIKALALAFSAGSGVYSYIRSERRHHESAIKQERKEAIAQLEAALVSSIQHLFVGETPYTIRANVMIVSGDELQMLASANMLVFPDYGVRLRKGQGCAGIAWEHAIGGTMEDFWKPVYATKAQLTAPLLRRKWKLTDEQISLTKHILWILSIPIFQNTGGHRSFLGVLNFDGVHSALRRPDAFSRPDFIGSCVNIGGRIAESVASVVSLAPES